MVRPPSGLHLANRASRRQRAARAAALRIGTPFKRASGRYSARRSRVSSRGAGPGPGSPLIGGWRVRLSRRTIFSVPLVVLVTTVAAVSASAIGTPHEPAGEESAELA